MPCSISFLRLTCLLCFLYLSQTAHAAETYTYDAAGRLTHVVYADSSWITYTYDANGNITKINSHAHVQDTTAVREGVGSPVDIGIDAIIPNPTTRDAVVRFHMAANARVTLCLVDEVGREWMVIDERRAAGEHAVDLSGVTRALVQGVYRVVLRAGASSTSRTFVLVR
jgi:YD repeat-containing protein